MTQSPARPTTTDQRAGRRRQCRPEPTRSLNWERDHEQQTHPCNHPRYRAGRPVGRCSPWSGKWSRQRPTGWGTIRHAALRCDRQRNNAVRRSPRGRPRRRRNARSRGGSRPADDGRQRIWPRTRARAATQPWKWSGNELAELNRAVTRGAPMPRTAQRSKGENYDGWIWIWRRNGVRSDLDGSGDHCHASRDPRAREIPGEVTPEPGRKGTHQ